MRRDELRRVTSKQKLLLVVDLDHTMLNSARFMEVPQEEEAYLAAAYLGPNAASSSAATVGIVYCIAYFMDFYSPLWLLLAGSCFKLLLPYIWFPGGLFNEVHDESSC
jgi:hypothetical protein